MRGSFGVRTVRATSPRHLPLHHWLCRIADWIVSPALLLTEAYNLIYFGGFCCWSCGRTPALLSGILSLP
jgi:hypothetical protein